MYIYTKYIEFTEIVKSQFSKDKVFWGMEAIAQLGGSSLLKTVESTWSRVDIKWSQHKVGRLSTGCSMLNRGTLATTGPHPHIIPAGPHKTQLRNKHYLMNCTESVCKGEACPGQRLYSFEEVNTNTRNRILCPPTIRGTMYNNWCNSVSLIPILETAPVVAVGIHLATSTTLWIVESTFWHRWWLWSGPK